MTSSANATPSRRATRAGRTRTGSRAGSGALHVGERPGAAAADLEDQLRRALDGACAAVEVDAALEAIAGVAREAEASHLALDHGRIPERAFEIHARRVVGDARSARRP